MKNRFFVSLAVVCAFFSLNALAEWTHECSTAPHRVCVFKESGGNSSDVLYYFHGKGGNQMQWMLPKYYTEGVRKAWTDAGVKPPVVVGISFGPVWLMVEKNSRPDGSDNRASGMFEIVRDQIMPAVEKQIGFSGGKRLLLGESMGGFNATQLAYKTDLFDRAAVLSPPYTVLTPFSPDDQIKAFVDESQAKPGLIKTVLSIAKTFMPTPEAWEKSSPMVLGEKLLGANSIRMYLSCGDKDEYGFYPGSEKFAELAAERGAPLTWEKIPGGPHSAANAPVVAQFLLE